MMLGAILDTETPLRQRIDPALNHNFPADGNQKTKAWYASALSGAGRHGMAVLAGSSWLAAALSLTVCLVLIASALHMLEPDAERRIVQLVDHHRLLSTALFLGSQAILVLALVAYGNRSLQRTAPLSETAPQLVDAMTMAEIGLWRWNDEPRSLWLTDRSREILRLAPAQACDPAELAALIHPDDLTRLQDEIIAASRSGATFDVNARLASQDGQTERWLRCRGLSEVDDQGRITRVSGTVFDISDRMAMQAEIDRQRQSLIHLSRVGTIGKLSGALAHELAQPLTAIMHNAHAINLMLSKKPLNLKEVRNAISDIIEDDSRVRDVIRHLRALLRKDNAEFGPVDMTLLIHKVLGLVRKELALHRVKPVVTIAPDFPPVWGDEVQLQQLLLNLIMNAVDAMQSNGKQGGSLSIAAFSTEGPGAAYHLCISDTGGGFKPGAMEKLFEPFFSTKDQGLGLGLSISEAIVSGHNGTIRAENNAEGGATFHITLPTVNEKTT